MGAFITSTLFARQENPPSQPSGAFRPPNWSKPQQTFITAKVVQSDGTLASTIYFFDAVLRLDHVQELRSTQHPIQSGASIVDHSYVLPARLTLEIGISDAMQSYGIGQYTSNNSRSVSAYQKFLELQKLRTPLGVSTRLNVYSNMVIRNIIASEDVRTGHALRAAIYLEEIIVAQVTLNTVSARPNQTSNNNLGVAQPEPVPNDLLKYLNPDGLWNSNKPNLPPSN